MPVTNIELGQRACVLSRIAPISSFADGTLESEVLGLMYEPTVRAELSSHPWKFAIEHYSLTGMASAATPLSAWSTAWPLPSTTVEVFGLYLEGSEEPEPFERKGDYILTHLSADDKPVIVVTTRPEEKNWPDHFIQAMTYRLAGLLCTAVTSREQKGATFNAMADGMRSISKFVNATSSTTQKITLNRLRNRRRGN